MVVLSFCRCVSECRLSELVLQSNSVKLVFPPSFLFCIISTRFFLQLSCCITIYLFPWDPVSSYFLALSAGLAEHKQTHLHQITFRNLINPFPKIILGINRISFVGVWIVLFVGCFLDCFCFQIKGGVVMVGQSRFRASKHDNWIATIIVRVISCFQLLQAEYFRHILKPVT